MKLATLKNNTRDGQLVVVSRDNTRCAPCSYATLQSALDEWSKAEGVLNQVFNELNSDPNAGQPFSVQDAHSPLPRAYQWADGSAYINHVELVRKARNSEVPESFYTDPLMYQGGSDSFLAPTDPIKMTSLEYGIDLEAEIVVITDDVPMGATVEQAGAAIRLVMLVNDVSLRGLIPAELAKGFGFFQSKPSSAFSPIAVTPAELGDLWQNYTLAAEMKVDLNDAPFGRARIDRDMTFNMAQLVAHAAKTRPLSAGAIIGSGTVSNKGQDGGPGRPITAGGVGYSCLAEVRTVETLLNGQPSTPFLNWGDRVQIEVLNTQGHSIFGQIDQRVEQA